MIDNVTCRKFLRQYGYKTTPTGMSTVLNIWSANKADLLTMFRKHPNWNEDALAIILPNTEFKKEFSRSSLVSFEKWANRKVPVLKKTKASEEISEKIFINKLDDLRAMLRYSARNQKKIVIDGSDLEEVHEKAQKEYDDYKEKVKDLIKIEEDEEKAYYITETFMKNIDDVLTAMNYITNNVNDTNITEEQARQINSIIDVGAVEGQKLSRVINKLCTKVGLNEIREEQTTINDYGDEITRQIGYQHQFNVMAEQVQNNTYKVHVVISLNPMDYWGMSLGKKWASCMSIDKLNIRNTPNTYSGAYSGGTESYMLDESTVVMYTIVEDYKGDMYYLQDKLNRCLFSIGKDGMNIVQHRVYPDARDGGDQNKSQFYRSIMQEIVSQLNGYENQWTLKRGSNYCREWTITRGSHYADYTGNSDCNVSVIKGKELEAQKINIGHKTICPACGREHESSESILCDTCRREKFGDVYVIANIFEENKTLEDENENPAIESVERTTTEDRRGTRVICDCCESEIDYDDAIEIDGNYYCDDDCAAEAGYHYIEEDSEYHSEDDGTIIETENDGWHLEENCYQDAYNDGWYYGDPYIEAEDGTTFSCEENAWEYGYEQDREGCWYSTDEMRFNENAGEWVHQDDCIEINGEYFFDENDAINHDYRKDVNGDWYYIDDVFYDEYEEEYYSYDDDDVIQTIDDRFFGTEDSAKDSGYICVNDKWMKREDALYDEMTDTYFTSEDAEVVTVDGNYYLYETSAIMAGYRETEDGWVKVEEARESA